MRGRWRATVGAWLHAGDEFHLLHVVKGETEQLREYYQEKSLVRPWSGSSCNSPTRLHVPSATGQSACLQDTGSLVLCRCMCPCMRECPRCLLALFRLPA
jgi:hypothetical protein